MKTVITVHRIHLLNDSHFLKAFVDIAINDAILIKSVKVLQGMESLIVTMPQEQAADKKWYDRIQLLTREIEINITNTVLKAYVDEVAKCEK